MGLEATVNPFTDYVADDVLLSLQRPRTDAATEPAFLITTQVMELLFKLSYLEALRVRNLLEADDLAGALWTLRRLGRVQRVLYTTWDVLSAVSPTEYGEFRSHLGEGSGFQSQMYRQLEFVLGNKSRALAEMHRGDDKSYRDLRRALSEPSVYDAALRLLRRRGLPIPDNCVERDWSEPYDEKEAVVRAWRLVYTAPDGERADLFQLGEALVDVAYDFGRWRAIHLLTVERVLGSKEGTAGTSGVKWLRRVAEHRHFPELWTVRGTL